jgi:TPR repeat protein
MYEYDKSGIKQNEAEKWYRLAAEKGNWSARYALKTMEDKLERNINLGICILAGVVVTAAAVLRRLNGSKSWRTRGIPRQ